MADSQKHGRTANLFDYETMAISAENSYLNADGSIGSSTDWNISDYIPCDGTNFTVGKIGGITPAICLYNANKEYITGKSYNTGGTYSKQAVNITSQSTAKYIRFSYCKGSLNPDDISAIMLNNGSTLLPFQPYLDWQHSLKKFDGTDWIDATVKEWDDSDWQ